MQKNSPDFIGIGAEFSGLGILTQVLAEHPAVVDTIPTLNFFNSDKFITKGTAWYESVLPKRGKISVIGECTPSYLEAIGVAERIVTEYPDTKLFVVVRNPIDRAIAQYVHACKVKQINSKISCSKYLTTHLKAQTAGFYGKHLHDFFAYYSSLQLHVIVYEDFVKDPLRVTQTLYAFLGLDATVIPRALSAYAPPPEEPKHRGRISRLMHYVIQQSKNIRAKKTVALVPAPFEHSSYFSPGELETFKRVFAVDSTHLTNLLHRDMPVFWGLVEETTRENENAM